MALEDDVRRVALAYILIALAALLPLPASAAGSDVVFTGSGWGHGVGMTQYGAQGMALQGSTSSQILSYYYPTTQLGGITATAVKPFLLSEPMPLWVSLMQNQTTITFRPRGGAATLCLESGDQVCPMAAGADETWRFEVLPGGCLFSKQVGGTWTPQTAAGTCRASVTPNDGATSIEMVFVGNRYANGVLRLRPGVTITGVHAVWQTAIEPYVRGITEIPDSWHPETLRTQAIAARSYALARAGWRGSAWEFSNDRKDACYCNLYATTSDQVWKGATGAANNPNFAAAAAATAGSIVVQTVGTNAGKVAETVYSSSSGGTTERNSDYWGGLQLPYLVNVSDSAAHLPTVGNPNSAWTRIKANSDVAAALQFDSVTSAQVIATYASGSAKTVRFTGTKGGQSVATDVSGNWVRSTFGLPSRYFAVAADGSVPSTPTTTFPVTDGTAPSTTASTSTSTSTSTTIPSSTTSTSTTTTTTAPTTTTTEAVVIVAAPKDPGTGEPAPVTNKAEEARGEGEKVPPPPVPVDDGAPSQTILWTERLIGDEATPTYATIEWTSPTTSSAPQAPVEAPAVAEAASAEGPAEIVIPVIQPGDALPELSDEPSDWRQTVYDAASAIGEWVSGLVDWVDDLVSP